MGGVHGEGCVLGTLGVLSMGLLDHVARGENSCVAVATSIESKCAVLGLQVHRMVMEHRLVLRKGLMNRVPRVAPVLSKALVYRLAAHLGSLVAAGY